MRTITFPLRVTVGTLLSQWLAGLGSRFDNLWNPGNAILLVSLLIGLWRLVSPPGQSGERAEEASGLARLGDTLDLLPHRLFMIRHDASRAAAPDSTIETRPQQLPPAFPPDTRRILMLIAALVLLFPGMLLLSAGWDRGTPSRILLSESGCAVVRLARASPQEPLGICVLQGYFRPGIFGDGARLDVGHGLLFDISGHQILGRIDDPQYSAPRGQEQQIYLWLGGTLLIGVGLLLLMVFTSISKPVRVEREGDA